MNFDPTAPKISIVTPIYNSAPFLAQTLASIQRQSLTDWEAWLVVDTKSRDQSLDIARQWAAQDARFKVLPGPTPGGVAGNRNAGVQAARARHLAFVDSDDLWRPQKLEVQLQFMQKHNSALSFHRTQFMSEDGQLHGRSNPIPSEVSTRDLLNNNCIGCSTVMIDRSRYSPGSIEFPQLWLEDLRLWLKLLRQVPTAQGIAEILSDYRVRQDSISANKIKVARHRWNLICDFESNPALRVSSFCRYAVAGLRKHSYGF